MKLTGIIMAGGKNSRMGTDKALLRVGSLTLIENAVQQLKKVAENIIIVTPRPESLSFLRDVETVSDIFPGCGPLGGIHAGMSYSPTDLNLVVACDMPFFQPGLLKYLAGYGYSHDVVIPRLGTYLEPLSACYNKSCLKVIDDQIRKGRLKIISFFDRVDVMYVDRDKLVELVDPDIAFLNVNTPQDLSYARELINKLGLP